MKDERTWGTLGSTVVHKAVRPVRGTDTSVALGMRRDVHTEQGTERYEVALANSSASMQLTTGDYERTKSAIRQLIDALRDLENDLIRIAAIDPPSAPIVPPLSETESRVRRMPAGLLDKIQAAGYVEIRPAGAQAVYRYFAKPGSREASLLVKLNAHREIVYARIGSDSAPIGADPESKHLWLVGALLADESVDSESVDSESVDSEVQ